MTGTATPRETPSLLTRPAVHAGLVAFAAVIAAQLWSYHANTVFAFWDAQSHLDIARRVVDSTTPGLQMLGTVWLPVPHLLLLPFTLVDAWWWSGIAGSIVGTAAFVVTIASLHDILARRIPDRRIAWIGTLFALTNLSLLYLATTAMTEPLLLASLTASACGIDRWMASGSRRALWASAVMAALAVGTRYDGWFFVLIATPAIAWIAARRGDRWLRDAAVFAAPSAAFVALWLVYNGHYFGDPLAFQRGIWSAQSQQHALAAEGNLPTRGRLDRSITYYLGAVVLSSGLVLTLVAALAIPFALRLGRAAIAAWLLLTALPFNIMALWAGQSAIALPWSHPAGILNLRYGVMLVPALSACVALGMARLASQHPARRRAILLAGVAALLVQGAWSVVGWPDHVGALREGLAIRDGDRRQQAASDWLRAHYDGGRVLVDENVNISPRTRVALRQRVYRWTWQLGPAALAAPHDNVDWVVVDSDHVDGAVARSVAAHPDFAQHFDQMFDDHGLQIWRRR